MLWNCMRVTMEGLEVLRHLRGLSDLSLRGCSQLPDALCYPVAHLHALTRLDLRNCERFTGARRQSQIPKSPSVLPVRAQLHLPCCGWHLSKGSRCFQATRKSHTHLSCGMLWSHRSSCCCR